MSTKHTPGPWHLRLSDNATPHIEHGDCLLDEVGELSNRICVMPAEIAQSFNSFANARLIAAAPDLLELLERAVRRLEVAHQNGDSIMREWVIDARVALAKATGSAA